jgi:hypothetical protein
MALGAADPTDAVDVQNSQVRRRSQKVAIAAPAERAIRKSQAIR